MKAPDGSVTLRFEGLPPSAQNAYRIIRLRTKNGGTYQQMGITAAGKRFKEYALLKWRCGSRPAKSEYYAVDFVFFIRWRNADGKLRKWDIDNHIKLAQDALADAIEIDDSQIISGTKSKRPCRPGEKEHHLVRIRVVDAPEGADAPKEKPTLWTQDKNQS